MWNIPAGPIANLTSIIEDHGIAVCSFDFSTERVDSRCVTTEDEWPIIFINSHQLGDRRRFSLAYELGHMVMHMDLLEDWTRDTNHEAKLFAAEFLMPEKDIRKDFEEEITVRWLGVLKKKWRVSMISLLYRADDLGFISPTLKRSLIQQFNVLQIRRREPLELDVPIEKPKLIKQWLAKLKSQTKRSTADLAEKMHMNTDEFIELYNE
jgi:Zn-dependent peptidase ImmA (M78 family)